jgi:hypothetical protein
MNFDEILYSHSAQKVAVYYKLCMTNLKNKYKPVFSNTMEMSDLIIIGLAVQSALVVFI